MEDEGFSSNGVAKKDAMSALRANIHKMKFCTFERTFLLPFLTLCIIEQTLTDRFVKTAAWQVNKHKTQSRSFNGTICTELLYPLTTKQGKGA